MPDSSESDPLPVTPSESPDRGSSEDWVSDQVRQGNPWYVDSQFEWAERPSSVPIYRKRFEFFRQCIGRVQERIGRPPRALDVGCGDGYWLWRMAELADVEWTGLDYNPVRVERARQVAPHADIRQADITELDPGEPFDVILLNQVIEHVSDDVEILRRIGDLLSDQGTLILGTTNEGCGVQRLAARLRRSAPPTDHVHFYTEPVIRQRIEQAGLVVDDVMREVFFVGIDPLFYWLTARGWGFNLLEGLTRLFPSQCSDYYFECKKPGPKPA
jgi:SAM-dependent methyltransferase